MIEAELENLLVQKALVVAATAGFPLHSSATIEPARPPVADGRPAPWIRCTKLNGEPVDLGLAYDSTVLLNGIFQLDLFWPRHRLRSDALPFVDVLSDGFERGQTLFSDDFRVKLNATPRILPVATETDWYVFSVQVPFQVFVSR